MTDLTIEADQFGATLTQLLGNVDSRVTDAMPDAVEKALKRGEKAWKKNAKDVLSRSYSRGGWGNVRGGRKRDSKRRRATDGVPDYYGKTFITGPYQRSITHHMLSKGRATEGEIGSKKMPGLAHLLEKGHAAIGGGMVPAYVHIAPASEEAFRDFDELVDEAVEEALK